MTLKDHDIIPAIEAYLKRFAVLADEHYFFPLALWTVGTFLYDEVDAFPYLVITSAMKRSGKSRLGELLSFMARNPRNFGDMTTPTLFHSMDTEMPTLFIDEAEQLSRQGATSMRSVLNIGYRKGRTVPRMKGNQLVEYNTYCPKVFILIGDVYDTLKDRSIVVRTVRADPPERFQYDAQETEGAVLRSAIDNAMDRVKQKILACYRDHAGVKFLTDRDEEIWLVLFAIAQILCPERIPELSRNAVDVATEKTQESRRYVQLENMEDKAQLDEYAQRLLMDLHSLFAGGAKVISTATTLERLKALDTAPWRKYNGKGLTMHDLANMLTRFGVRPVNIRVGYGRKDSRVMRGYKAADVAAAIARDARK